jgi:hypothetical protein
MHVEDETGRGGFHQGNSAFCVKIHDLLEGSKTGGPDFFFV